MDRANYTPREYYDDDQYRSLLIAGIAAVKSGDRQQGYTLLHKASEMKPTDPQPWLWLSATTDDPKEQRDYLEYALAADPNNTAARRGLVMLSGKLDHEHVLAEGQEADHPNQAEPLEAKSTTAFMCSRCGGNLSFDVSKQKLVCQSCGNEEELDDTPAADTGEQVIDFVLPTTRGHLWAEASHQLNCSQCGAVTILAVAERDLVCPYCGSSQLIESAETLELVKPNVIAVASLDNQAVNQNLKAWLGRGFFIPDNLKKLAKPSALRSAYYPFWTFDGTLQMNWVCEVNEGSSDAPSWVIRRGVELEMFDDVTIAGFTSLDPDLLQKAEPLDMKDVVEYHPSYLAGWDVLAYDHPLTESSLDAREMVVKRVRRELPGRIHVGGEVRHVQSGEINWSGMTYKLVLFPFWTGTYRYQGKIYRLLINGQTGRVAGEKPVDRVKVTTFWILIVLSFLVIFLFSFLLAVFSGWIQIG